MLGLNDQFGMEKSVHWYAHVLRREGIHVLRRALSFLVKC